MAGTISAIDPGSFPALYAASVAHMDAAIGWIVKALDEADQLDNTLIFFTSDNGGQQNYASNTEYGGKHGPYPTLGDNRPLRGWKGELYEGGIRVPAFVYWRGKLRPTTVREAISLLDWLPTFAAVTGMEIEEQMKIEGRNVWPVLSGATTSLAPPTLYWKTDAAQGLLDGDWKLIIPGARESVAELYNLAADPYEQNNLAAKHPRQVELLSRILEDRASQPIQEDIQSKP